MTKISAPQYVSEFKCIGGACEDSCCIGWDVDIDLDTFKKYENVKDSQMKRLFQKYIYRNPAPTDLSIDYAKVELTQDKHCPFLNADHLCMIQKYLGEPCLSNVCAFYPRIFNEINGRLEMTLSPSCPEAMRLIIKSPDAMQLTEIVLKDRTPVITYKVNTRAKQYKESPVRNLKEIQDRIERILVDRQISLENRFLRIGTYIESIYRKKTGISHENLPCETGAEKINGKTIDLVKKLIGQFRPFDSEAYTIFCDGIEDVFSVDMRAYAIFMDQNPHVLENYFLNLMRKGLFPFTESESIMEAYLLYFIRFIIIRTQLAAVSSIEGELTDQTVVRYLQSFSKVFEHHRTFAYKTIEILKKENLTSVKQLQKLLTID